MAKHNQGFLKIVDDARSRITECTVQDVKTKFDAAETFHLIDVREESEWARGRIPNSVHLGKGIIERDVEQLYPDLDTVLILYCGGGYRSALAADNLTQMGYRQVISMDGGIRGWREAGFEIDDSSVD
ncbi:MAG: sulfurtransferase [Planctomycetaceae bacterium]|nr:sulfurtransferase [Planctomycetaceae bacterium]